MADGLWERPFPVSEDGFDGLPTQIQLLGGGDALVALVHGSSEVGKCLGAGENPGPQVMERSGIQAKAFPLGRQVLKGWRHRLESCDKGFGLDCLRPIPAPPLTCQSHPLTPRPMQLPVAVNQPLVPVQPFQFHARRGQAVEAYAAVH